MQLESDAVVGFAVAMTLAAMGYHSQVMTRHVLKQRDAAMLPGMMSADGGGEA